VVRRSLLALAALGIVLGLVACGGVTDPLNPLALSAQKSASAGGVKMRLDAKFSFNGRSSSLSADGAFDGDQGELTLHTADLLGGRGFSLGDLKGILSMADLKVITTKQDGKPVLYLQAPGLIPGGKPWIKLDVEQALAALGAAGKAQGLLGVTGQSPADALKLLEQVGSVAEVGTETIDGAETTHYHATVDVAEALANAGAPAEALAAVKASGVATKVPVDVWIGTDDGYVHRMHVSYGSDVNGQSFSGELTMTLSDWGTDVSVDVPDDSEVLDVTALLAGFGAHP
jgi:hypothetical protein